MLKTFAKSLTTETGILLRQLGASVTGLRNKYRQDIFFRTECNVILLQVGFALVLLSLVAYALNYLYQSVTEGLVNGIMANIASGGSFTADDIIASVQGLKTANFIVVFVITALITALFGYILARVTLAPARSSLAAQKRFISDIAHELRTPLSIIKTNSEVALLNENIKEDMRKNFESNIEELSRASEIINNLLSFSNLVQPEKVKFVESDIGKIAATAMKKLTSLADRKEIKMVYSRKHPTILFGNPTALEQICVNLIKNAINYTPEGGKIKVIVEPDFRKNIVLTVSDTGIGIADKDLIHIFEPFYRADRSRSRRYGSSGLGLTIVSELVKLHRGSITVKSTLGRGSTFSVWLPRSGDVSPSESAKKPGEVSLNFS